MVRNGDGGEIDLLAKHRQALKLLVIELKKDRSGTDALGQVLGYMGWVKKQYVAKGQDVSGLIITAMPETKLVSAVSRVPNVALWAYIRTQDRVIFRRANTAEERELIQREHILVEYPVTP